MKTSTWINPKVFLETNNGWALFNAMLLFHKCGSACPLHSYLAARHYPVGNSQKGQTYGDPQNCPALHSDRLLPQSGEVLVPDRQQLLLTVGMCNKLEKAEKRNKGVGKTAGGTICYPHPPEWDVLPYMLALLAMTRLEYVDEFTLRMKVTGEKPPPERK